MNLFDEYPTHPPSTMAYSSPILPVWPERGLINLTCSYVRACGANIASDILTKYSTDFRQTYFIYSFGTEINASD